MNIAHPEGSDKVVDGEYRYADVLARQAGSRTLHTLFRLASGDEYPDEAAPFGFVTRTELARIADLLLVSAADLFADFGCGCGGPGLWLARATGASLIGLDLLPDAIDQAERRKAEFVPEHRASFRVASFAASGLPDHGLDAVVSIDSLWMVEDKPAAVAEVARVLKPGGRFVFTTWEPSPLDYLALLAAAGLTVVLREETAGWLARQLTFYEGVLVAADLLRRELGAAGSQILLDEAHRTPQLLPAAPRLLIVATR